MTNILSEKKTRYMLSIHHSNVSALHLLFIVALVHVKKADKKLCTVINIKLTPQVNLTPKTY